MDFSEHFEDFAITKAHFCTNHAEEVEKHIAVLSKDVEALAAQVHKVHKLFRRFLLPGIKGERKCKINYLSKNTNNYPHNTRSSHR